MPVFAVAFLDDAHVVCAGGGGAGRTGVANALAAFELVRGVPALVPSGEITLARDEDAPMCVAAERTTHTLVCGINSGAAALARGDNDALRIFSYTIHEPAGARADKAQGKAHAPVSLAPVRAARSLAITDGEQYMRTCTFAPDARFVAVGSSDGRAQLHRFPSLEPVWASDRALFADGDEVYDADFSADGTLLVLTTPKALVIVTTAPKGAATGAEPRIIQTLTEPGVGRGTRASFRAARFGRGDTRHRLYTLVNTTGRTRASYISVWDADQWHLECTRRVCTRPATVLALSERGDALAVGTSDLALHILSTHARLAPLVRVANVHDFPPTCVAFSPSGTHVVSGSADSSLRLIELPPGGAHVGVLVEHGQLLYVVLLVVALLIALAAMRLR